MQTGQRRSVDVRGSEAATARPAVAVLLLTEDGPGGHEERRDQRTDHEAVDAEDRDAADGRDKHDVVGQPGVAPDEDRAQQIVDEPDHEHADEDQDNALPGLTDRDKVGRGRHPDQRRADRGQERQEGHQGAPEQRPLDAEGPEGDAADRALDDRDHHVALDGGPHHRREAREKRGVVLVAERHRRADVAADVRPSRNRKKSR